MTSHPAGGFSTVAAPSVPDDFRGDATPQISEETVPRCNVCRHDRFDPFAFGFDYEMQTCRNTWRFVQCRDCGHVWLNPRPALSTLLQIYPSNYYAYNYGGISSVSLRAKAWMDRSKIRTILRHCRGGLAAYLDVGCGDGRYLRAVEQRGVPRARLFGLELSTIAADRLAVQGYQVRCQRVEQADGLPEGGIDLVTMFHVLEHVDDPRDTVESIRRWLSPGGVLAVETPNIASLDARLFLRGLWGGYHIPRHWHLFSTDTLTRLLRDVGLEIVAVRYQTGHSFWMYSFHHLLRFRSRRFRWLAGAFNPLRSPVLLAFFTAFDKVRAILGFRTSAVLIVARRPLDS
jgi:SAM-dependent methyltransferase